MNRQNMKPSDQELLEFLERILNDEDEYLCCILYATLTSEQELEGNKKNQESSLSISKFIIDNLDKMNIESKGRKTFIREYFGKIPEIVAQYQK